MNLLLWTTRMDDDMLPVVESLKRMGFDGVEVPVFDLDPTKWESWAKRLDKLGLERIAVTFCSGEFNPISPDAAVRAKAVQMLKDTVTCSKLLGAKVLSGPIHSALNVFTGKGATEHEWAWSVAAIREVAEFAATQDVTLGIEYLNRFESYLLTCTADALRFVKDVAHPNCRVMFDTFHANIEEKNVGESIRSIGNELVHVQISENDRSTPGKGNVRWDAVFDALKVINYDAWLSIEAFGLTPEDLAAGVKIWRRMFESEHQLAEDGLAFLQAEVAKRWEKEPVK